MKRFICLLLSITFITASTLVAQKVQIQGEAEITQLDTANNQELFLVKNIDGTIAVRELSSLPGLKDTLSDVAEMVADTFRFFNKKKVSWRGGAFPVGPYPVLPKDSTGIGSFGFGEKPLAKGNYGFAFGKLPIVRKPYGFSFGLRPKAIGEHATSIGKGN